jgi:2,4-diaminopentanoate dehydrogenase
MPPYRVIQWATGGMGRNTLRAVIDHPAMQLVGVFVYGASKVGRDAGELSRRPATGVIATNDRRAIAALDADVVIHAGRIVPPYGSHDADLITLLESGKNVVSINGYTHPAHWGGARLAALEAACARGGATLTGAGLNPGFVGEQLALVATSVCSELDHVEIVECASCIPVRNPTYVFETLGFGADPAAIDPNDSNYAPAAALNGMYEEVLAAMAHRLGLTLDRVVTEHRALPATHDLQVAAGQIARGRVGHFHWRWRGLVGGVPRLTISIHWYMESAHLPEPNPPLWRVHIAGQPGVRLTVEFEKRSGDVTPTSAEQIALAGSVINAIPVVCAAAPGVLSRPIATPWRAMTAP